MSVKLKGALPTLEKPNGLYAVKEEMIQHPRRLRVLVLVVDTDSVRTKSPGTVDEVQEPTARILHVEPMRHEEDVTAALEALARARAERLGQDELNLSALGFPSEVEAMRAATRTPEGDAVPGDGSVCLDAEQAELVVAAVTNLVARAVLGETDAARVAEQLVEDHREAYQELVSQIRVALNEKEERA